MKCKLSDEAVPVLNLEDIKNVKKKICRVHFRFQPVTSSMCMV
jgi:hypothetical protein